MCTKFKTLPLYLKILAGMFVGILAGLITVWCNVTWLVSDWIAPFGTIFMRMLKFAAIPLIFISLIKGIGNLKDISALSSMGLRTLGIYIATTLVAILVGVAFGSLVFSNDVVVASGIAQSAYVGDANQIANTVVELKLVKDQGPLVELVNMVPDNIFAALSNNANMLQVIFASILIGIAVLLIGSKGEPLMNLVDSLDSMIVKVIDIVMIVAPVGVFALMAGMVADSAGDFRLLGALGVYSLTVIVALLLLTFGFYPLLIRLFSRIPVRSFLRNIFPVQLLAFTTSSSAATLPFNMETVQKKLGISNRTASFVLPVGTTINMDGTSCYQAISVLFIAHVMGVELGWGEIATIVSMTTIASIGTPGIPGGSIVMTVMVLTAIGIPAEGLALILGIDRPLDMLRTVVNVTGDATVASIIDRS